MKNNSTRPNSNFLTKTVLNDLESRDIIYAEITSAGGMGNAGGVILNVLDNENKQLISYETNIFDDEETYLLADKILFKSLDRENIHTESDREKLDFDLYYAGMANYALINKNVTLEIQDDHFTYSKDNITYKITGSRAVFYNVVSMMKKGAVNSKYIS